MTRRVIQAGALMSPRAGQIVYNSTAARAQHERYGYLSNRGVVIPNGFDTDRLRADEKQRVAVRRELRIHQNALVMAHVARFHPAKDYPTLLRATARVKDTFPEVVLVLVGEGVDTSNKELDSLVADLDLHDRLRLLGRRDDVGRLMAAFDVLCLTSVAEGFPNVLGEAMSCGVPCVGTAVGDVAELIGDTGEIVPRGDSEAVAAAVGRLLALEPAARQALGARARQRIIERFSIGEVARRYADVLQAVVQQRR
jgi:glycosyltransferase involved in cell wall biosynthesis